MDRRTLLKRTGTVGAVTIGGTGLASAREPTHVSWTFDDGHTEVLSNAEFERRPDTPSLSDLDISDDLSGCCCCNDVERCHPCFVCRCP